MFQSFFPRPKLFLLSALGWVAVAVALWYTQGGAMGAWFGFPPTDPAAEPVLGLGHFVTPQFLWFYLYCAAFLAAFTAAWFILSPHPYQWWSVVGTAVILFSNYFNVFRGMYLQADNVFAYLILIPTIAAGQITFGLLQQILTAFGRVSDSFQYLVNSWSTIIELLSIHKRLAAFDAAFEGRALAPIEQEHPLTP